MQQKRRPLFTLIFNSNLSVKRKVPERGSSIIVLIAFKSDFLNPNERNLPWNVYILTLSSVLWRSITLGLKCCSNVVTTSYDTHGCYTLAVKKIGCAVGYVFYLSTLFKWLSPTDVNLAQQWIVGYIKERPR